jgi:uncharacterized membrane protein
MPEPAKPQLEMLDDRGPDRTDGIPVLSTRSGYVRYLDCERLVAAAKQQKVVIDVVRRVGHFVPAGVPIVRVWKPEKLSPALVAEIRACYDIGPTRTLQQDIEFGILQIVDIALRAVSPAVNDPSTAICCVDHLSRILIRCAGRQTPRPKYFDPPGTLRLTVPVMGVERLVHSAFDQVRIYAKGDVAVNLRLLRALGDIAIASQDPRIRKSLAALGSRIVAGTEAMFDEEEMRELRQRLYGLQQLSMDGDAPRVSPT